jgi:hypothetical protein
LRFERDTENLRTKATIFGSAGLKPIKIDYPILLIALMWKIQNKEIWLHIEADNYDYQPVRGWWVNEKDEPLRQGGGIPSGNGFQVTSNPYNEDRSWFCFRGWREYHDHPSHQDIAWASIRNQSEYRLPGIISKLFADLNSQGISVS